MTFSFSPLSHYALLGFLFGLPESNAYRNVEIMKSFWQGIFLCLRG